jgi:hypothetical protein
VEAQETTQEAVAAQVLSERQMLSGAVAVLIRMAVEGAELVVLAHQT